jgi:hypothetical protein
MLLSKEVEVKLNGKKIKHYESLGYVLPKRKTKDGMRVPKNAIIKVKIEDIPLGSHINVNVCCDYCGEVYPTRYDGYIKRKQNDIQLDCCDQCKSIKNKELNLLRYGVENQFQREEVIEKTMFMKSKNNSIACSNQQKYLQKLFGGILNYVNEDTKAYAIDIALVDKQVAIEYHGSGHNLQVKFGNITQKEFENKEIVRYQILKRNGWKQIIIKSPYDYLPSDEKLLKEYYKALDWFKSDDKGHWHYNINIGKKTKDVKYDKLRRITDKDLEEFN